MVEDFTIYCADLSTIFSHIKINNVGSVKDFLCSLGVAGITGLLNYAEIETFITRLLKSCNMLCSTVEPAAPDTSSFEIASCSEIRTVITYILANKKLMATIQAYILKDKDIQNDPKTVAMITKIFTEITDLPSLCKLILKQGLDAKAISSIIIAISKKAVQGSTNKHIYTPLIEKYAPQITQLIECICPGLTPPSISPTPSTPSISPTPSTPSIFPSTSYNKKMVYITAGSIAILLVITIIITLVISRHKPITTQVAVCGTILTIGLLIFVGFMVANPKCMYLSCPKSSKPLTTITKDVKYHGSYSALGQATVSVTLTSITPTKVRLDLIDCAGSGCPTPKNLLSECTDNIVTIDLANKTSAGYPLIGSCIDKLKTIPTFGGDPAVQGMWIGEDSAGDLFINIQLHICTSGLGCILDHLMATVPLKKIGT
jgi:hypothetical protein